MARALYSNSELLILDEPSAALDPIAEQKLNKQLKNISNEKTVIYISHRLSSTVDADCIYVISNGQIAKMVIISNCYKKMVYIIKCGIFKQLNMLAIWGNEMINNVKILLSH